MILVGIDPGPEESGVAARIGGKWYFERCANKEVEANYMRLASSVVAIEWVSSYGMPVGKSVFDTVCAAARFELRAQDAGAMVVRILRPDVKLFLCNSRRAKDSNVMHALLDMYGGDRKAAIGTKKKPGPIYGCSSHCWSALATLVTAHGGRVG